MKKNILISIFFVFFISKNIYSEDFNEKIYRLFNELTGVPHTYEVRRYDTLYKVARMFDVTYPHIKRANMLRRNRLKRGEKLIIPTFRILPEKEAGGIILNIPELTLYYYENQKINFFSPVTCGRLSMKTPIGKFKIATKKLNPTWYPPEWAGLEKPVPPGPENPLGDRWMGLSRRGYGIHSTNAPRSIGKITSHGCIRMYPPDAERLFNNIKVGTPVEIIYQPIKFGYYQGKIYMEVNPDFYYYGTNEFEKVWKRIEEREISEVVSKEKIKEILEEERGIPIPIVGSDLKIAVSGEEIEFLISPIIINNIGFVELESLLLKLNSDVIYDEVNNIVKVMRKFDILEFSLSDRKIYFNGEEIQGGIPWYIVLGKVIVPLRFISEIFGYEIKQEEDINRLNLIPYPQYLSSP